ncbi:MAG: XrtA system polysaccharide chain length determinant [bacterium]
MDILKATRVNIGDYLQVIFRRKWLFIIPFFTIFLTTTIGAIFMPKIYESKAMLVVEEKQLLSPLVSGMAVAPTIEERLDILKEQITSWYRLAEMVEKLKLCPYTKDQTKINSYIQSIQKRIKVILKARFLIQVSFEDANPKVAEAVVNYITKSLVKEEISGQEEEALSAIKFIADQVKHYQEKLEEAEASLKDFKEKNLLELPGSGGSNLAKAIGIKDALLEIRLDLQEAHKTKQLLQRQLASEEKIITSKTTSINPVIEKLNAKLIELQTELSDLKAKKCTDEHPWVIALNDSIQKLEARIQDEKHSTISSEVTEVNPTYMEIESKLRDTEALIDSLSAREKQLQELATLYESRARIVPSQEQELTRLTRDMGVNESIYSMLLNRLETANISQKLEKAERGTRFKIIDPAREPLHPIKPDMNMMVFLAFVIGSIFGCGCVFLGEYTDHSFRSMEDAESVLAVPSLGSISKITTVEELINQRAKQKRRIVLVTIFTLCIVGVIVFVVLLTMNPVK